MLLPLPLLASLPHLLPYPQAREADALLRVLPTLTVRATCEVEGETEVMEGDPAKCKVGNGALNPKLGFCLSCSNTSQALWT